MTKDNIYKNKSKVKNNIKVTESYCHFVIMSFQGAQNEKIIKKI